MAPARRAVVSVTFMQHARNIQSKYNIYLNILVN